MSRLVRRDGHVAERKLEVHCAPDFRPSTTGGQFIFLWSCYPFLPRETKRNAILFVSVVSFVLGGALNKLR